MEKVTLYIPCFNAAKFIAACLESVLSQVRRPDEILVVDDGSTDETVRITRHYPARIIRHGHRRGIAAARNTALKQARHAFVAALDADCAAEAGWLEALLREFHAPDVAGVGGRLVEKNNQGIADRWRQVHMSQDRGEVRLETPPFLYGCNSVFRKDALAAIGFYDEQYLTNYEDCDGSARLLQKGFRLIYTPAARVVHLRRDSIVSALSAYWRWHFHAWPQPTSFRGLLCKTKENFGLLAHYGRGDYRAGNFRLFFLDILAFVHSIILDLKFYCQRHWGRRPCR